MSDKISEELSMEEAFDQLKAVLTKLESEDLSLEDNFKLYEEGLNLVKICDGKLDKIEKQLITLENGENQ